MARVVFVKSVKNVAGTDEFLLASTNARNALKNNDYASDDDDSYKNATTL